MERVNASDLQRGEVCAIDKDCIVVKTEAGVFGLSRYCPHQGADLSLGYIKDGQLHCPWHNLYFDPKTGHQPCRSLKNLNVFPVDDRLIT